MGRRFSGSTVLGRILDAAENAMCVGETLPIRHGYADCRSCGGACRLIDYEKLKDVRPEDFYRELHQACGQHVLVTTDKPFRYVETLTQPKSFDAVFVFKSPFAFAASEKRGHPRHQRRDGAPVFRPMPVGRALDEFCGYYERALHWQRPRFKYFVSIEHLAMDYPAAIPLLFDRMGLRYPGGVVDISKLVHHFAIGNYDAMDSSAFAPDCRWITELTEAEKQEVAEHELAQSLYRHLLGNSVV
jgi:hypothetical protein